MLSHVARWGNSLSVRVPKAFAEALALKDGDPIDLDVDQGRLIITPGKVRYSLDELVDGITTDNQPESHDDGPMGQELL